MSNPTVDTVARSVVLSALDQIKANAVLRHPSLTGASEDQKQKVIERVLQAKVVFPNDED